MSVSRRKRSSGIREFFKESEEEKSDGSSQNGDNNERPSKTPSTPRFFSSVPKKPHTVLEIEKISKERQSSSPSNDEEVDALHHRLKSRNVSGLSEDSIIEERRKTTSAILLAEEASDILGVHGQEDSPKTFWNNTIFVETRQRNESHLESYQKLLFQPSTNPIPVPASAPDEDLDNGLYFGDPAFMQQKNWNLLAWRLYTEANSERGFWFNKNGSIICYSDPYKSEIVQIQRSDDDFIEKRMKFMPATFEAPTEYKSLGMTTGDSELEIDLGFFYFLHHPLFSKEHVIAARLQTLYDDYEDRQANKVTIRAIHKLKALREVISHTKKSIGNLKIKLDEEDNGDKKLSVSNQIVQHKDRLKKYREELRKTSLTRDQGFWDDRATLAAVLETWKELKTLRESQGYSNTLLKLRVMELPTKEEREKERWAREIDEDVRDIEEECEEIAEEEMAIYNKKMRRWMRAKDLKKVNRESGDGVIVTESDDMEGDTESDVSNRRPKPPLKHDVAEIRKVVERRFKDVRRRPHEPNLVLELLKTSSITPRNQLPEDAQEEVHRRNALQKTRVEVHFFLNGQRIYVSRSRNINVDFSVFLGFKVPVGPIESLDSLELQVVDTSSRVKTLKVPLNLPNKFTTLEKSQMRKLTFYSSENTRKPVGAVGSGMTLEINGVDYGILRTKGYLTIRAGWSSEHEIQATASDLIKRDHNGDHELTLSDPNNPKFSVIEFRKEISPVEPHETITATISTPKKTSLREVNSLELCPWETIENSLRFKLLQLRDEGVPEFKNFKMISPFERDIHKSIFMSYEKRIKGSNGKTRPGMETYGRHRKPSADQDVRYESNRLERIRDLRIGVLQLFEKSLKQITFEDLVIEEQIPDIGTLGLNLMALFQPRRPLRPQRKERKRIQASNLVDTKVELIFNIVRAFNLPMRKDSDVGLLTTESMTGVPLTKKRNERSENIATIKPFVEVWFQRKKVRTTTALGSTPTWNQELQLSLSVPNDDFSQTNLSKMDDLIYLLVYDEVIVDILEDDRRRGTDIHQRIEKRWIGSITIPFSTLYSNGRIEGTFKLQMPPVLLGYELQGMNNQYVVLPSTTGPRSSTSLSNMGNTLKNTPLAFNHMNGFLTIFITLQPAVQPIISVKEDTASGESSDIISFTRNWKKICEAKHPKRIIRPFVMSIDGETILATRFLHPVEPPSYFTRLDYDLIHTMKMLAHYVSLFPYIRDSTLGINDYSLWIPSDIFINTPGGGTEDHSVLLACYFISLGVPTWVVQGNAIPDGPTTFVVTAFKGLDKEKELPSNLKNSIFIWNPCSGECFTTDDSYCPLQSVWAAIGKKNIWANVSESERPNEIDWNIEKSSGWLPLFPKGAADDKVPVVQNTQQKYKTEDQIQANSLAQRVERSLKDAFMKWRPVTKTNWNRYCSATLRRLLPRLEDSKSSRLKLMDPTHEGQIGSVTSIQSGSTGTVNEEHLTELREIMASHQMSGFPIQQAYVNLESIYESVFATGLHTIDTPDVEFAIACYAHAYPGSVYSVWVYVAALHSRR